MFSVRLACVKRAASVRPEPGSNSLWKLYIQTLRAFISILAITIRSQLPLWFFRLFWLLKIPNLFGISRAFSLVVHCSIFKILVSGFRAATFILYHIQKFLSSKQFMNQSSNRSLFPLPEQAAQNSQPLYSIALSLFCQVNFSWTLFQKLNCRTPVPFFRFFSLSFHSLDFRSRATALLLYHIHSPLSRKYILRFLRPFCLLCTKARGSGSISQAALP